MRFLTRGDAERSEEALANDPCPTCGKPASEFVDGDCNTCNPVPAETEPTSPPACALVRTAGAHSWTFVLHQGNETPIEECTSCATPRADVEEATARDSAEAAILTERETEGGNE